MTANPTTFLEGGLIRERGTVVGYWFADHHGVRTASSGAVDAYGER